MWLSSFPNPLYWKNYPFSIVCSLLLCHKLIIQDVWHTHTHIHIHTMKWYSTIKRWSFPKGKKKVDTVDKPDKHYLSQVIKGKVFSDVILIVCMPWMRLVIYVIRLVLYLCGLPSQNTESISNHEKNIRKVPAEEHSTKYLTMAL